MNQQLLQTDLTKLFGIDTLSPEDQAAFIEDIGGVVLETAVTRFIASLNDEQRSAFEHYLDTDPEPGVLLRRLITQYEHFSTILEDVVLEMKEDAVAVLGDLEKGEGKYST